jgi:ketosteroid isomerase-like protein
VPYDDCGMFVVRGGRIVEVREHLDAQHAAGVLGGPDPAA